MASTGVSDRVVIITGAGQGIGKAYAHGFARAGAKVVVAEIDEEKGARAAREIEADGGRALAIATDVSDTGSVEAMATQAMQRLGDIDVLVNNAAIHVSLARRPFWEIPDEEWDAVMRVNIGGYFKAARAVVPAMRKAGWGRIINISSAATLIGLTNYLHYVATKSAAIGMTRSMARELGGSGVTVNAVLPGQILTEVENPGQTDELVARVLSRQIVPRSGTPEDVLGMLLYLASPASDFVTGQSFVIDGGLAHL